MLTSWEKLDILFFTSFPLPVGPGLALCSSLSPLNVGLKGEARDVKSDKVKSTPAELLQRIRLPLFERPD